jgi:dimethylaniline monooxygenase (N-oxide forming)
MMSSSVTTKGPQPNARVAVVGLGACGLVTLKNLLEAGFEATGFDRNNYVGGLWKFSPENKTTVLKSTVANLSKQTGCFSDFPFPDHVGNYATADQFAQYFEDYAKSFSLLERVKLGRTVERIARSQEDEGWEIRFKQDGKDQAPTERFDKVILCHGLQVLEPNIPKIEGIDTFAGRAIHSNEYKGPEPFEGKTVVVVGFGNTGPDVACDLVGHASKVYLSHRKGHAIVGLAKSSIDQGQSSLIKASCLGIEKENQQITLSACGSQPLLESSTSISPIWLSESGFLV